MEMIDRYIYAVGRQLPQSERQEVEKEIRLLINDMIEGEEEKKSEKEKVESVLEKLGNPNSLASKYRSKERYLIGPKYFDKYLSVLAIVLLSIGIAMTVVAFINAIVSNESLSAIVINFIGTLLSALLQGGVWVTLIFAIFEYRDVDLQEDLAWSLQDLPEVPNKSTLISKRETLCELIFSTIFYSGLYLVPELIGIYYHYNKEWINIPLFNIDVFNMYKIMILGVLVISILQESMKIIWGRWNRKRALIYSFTCLVSGGLMIGFLSIPNMWNPKISIEQFLVPLILFTIIIEITICLYKGFKYSR